ncbi:MAG: hypothetical protein WDM88_13335 [Galbitalea sp.]
MERGARGPYFYLPKLENHLEARLWDDIFTFSENAVGIPHGTIRATVLTDRDHHGGVRDGGDPLRAARSTARGLNAGRWDYIFSIIKNFRDRGPAYVLPDRAQIAMTVPFIARLHRAARGDEPASAGRTRSAA